MKLSSYLSRNKISAADFAQKIGVEPVTVYRWAMGVRFPLHHLAKIEKATGGAVTANDFARDREGRTA